MDRSYVSASAETAIHDFDFFVGRWNTANRRLTKLFVGSDEWDEFPATTDCHAFFGGGGNFDEIVFPTKGFSGATLRLFDRTRQEWSLHWVNSREGTLFPPVVGRFANGRGDFYGDDTHEGLPIRAHFIWSRITPIGARWEQEFSADDGRTWETNWIMDFTRILPR